MNNDNKKTITQGNIFMSPLFRRFLTPIILTMMGFTLAIYFFAVPYLKNLVYSLEERSAKTNLQNIHKLIEANSLAIDAYKQSVTSAHKRQLKNMTLFMDTYLNQKLMQVSNGIISEEEAQLTALEELRAFRYGNNDYVWVADYQGFYLSHPDPKMNMEDFSEVRDVFGNYVLTPLIKQAMENGEGYNSFWWQRLENDLPAEKLTYAKLFPQWEWVIGTGVYLDDLETEIIMRKEKMIEELRQILNEIVIAKTGYMYILDAWHNILIHPDMELENMNMSSWENPSSGNKLAMDLIAASHTESNKVAYKWDRPDDKDNFIYDKIDWVTHVDDFDWYVVASVYTDELNTSSILLRNRIFILSVVIVIFSIIIVSLLMSRLLNPIRRLSYTAGLVKAGDLTAQMNVKGNDEISFLAKAFNAMISQLRETIENLDHKVLERTKDLNRANEDLTRSVGELEEHNWQVTNMNLMAKELQACMSLEDVYRVISNFLTGFFPMASGIVYMFTSRAHNEKVLKPVLHWGEHTHPVTEVMMHECNSFKNGGVILSDMHGNNMSSCSHVQLEPPYISICMPLMIQKKIIGMVNLKVMNVDQVLPLRKKEDALENWRRLAIAVSDQFAMALANMKLKEKLQDLSLRDDLTGLFNRRYMKETLKREFAEADRKGNTVGLVMLDVDKFKNLNDNYGHVAGDLVLIELANLLSSQIRKCDFVCRYGGEEFLIILPGIPGNKAIERAEMIRAKVETELKIKHNAEQLKITISLGTAMYPDNGSSPEEVVKAADAAMYRAKEQGRNTAVLA